MEQQFTEKEVLAFLMDNGKIKSDDVIEEMNKIQREKLLNERHPYKIWQSTDGRWRTYIATENAAMNRKLVIKTSKVVLEEFLIEHYQLDEKSRGYTLRTFYPEWLEYKRLLTTAEPYITRINTDWKKYYLDTKIIDIPLKKLDKLTLDTWAHRLIKDYQMTKNQYYNCTVIMRQALLYAVDRGIIPSSPFAGVVIDGKRLFRKVKKKMDSRQVFSKTEVKEITEMAWDDFYNHVKVYELAPLAVLFQLQTGVRIGEACAVKYEDIENPDYIHIQRMWRRDTREVVEHTKTDCGDRQIPLTSAAKKIIQAAQERQQELKVDSEYIFSIDENPLIDRAIATLYTKYCKKMGIIKKSSHTSRRTFISALIDEQVSINTVRQVAGHSSEKTTLRNYTFDRSSEVERREKFEKALAV